MSTSRPSEPQTDRQFEGVHGIESRYHNVFSYVEVTTFVARTSPLCLGAHTMILQRYPIRRLEQVFRLPIVAVVECDAGFGSW